MLKRYIDGTEMDMNRPIDILRGEPTGISLFRGHKVVREYGLGACQLAKTLLRRLIPFGKHAPELAAKPAQEVYFKRTVMVQFKADATPKQLQEFRQALLQLAAISSGLVNMDCGSLHAISGETELSKVSPNVQFGDFISIWTFASEDHLRQFVDNPEHKYIAAKYFKPVVANRYVINHRSSF